MEEKNEREKERMAATVQMVKASVNLRMGEENTSTELIYTHTCYNQFQMWNPDHLQNHYN